MAGLEKIHEIARGLRKVSFTDTAPDHSTAYWNNADNLVTVFPVKGVACRLTARDSGDFIDRLTAQDYGQIFRTFYGQITHQGANFFAEQGIIGNACTYYKTQPLPQLAILDRS